MSDRPIGAPGSVPPAGSYESSDAPWPVEIRLQQADARLEIDFDDGRSFVYPAEYLRVESPSAEVQGHSAAQKRIVPGKRNVQITSLEPVGNYAIRIAFDDGHDTGLFSWAYLRELGETYDSKWRTYLAALRELGLSRES